MARTDVTEWRPGRNFVRLGDVVKVAPSKPGKHDGFTGRVTRMVADDGTVTEVTLGTDRGVRTVRADRVHRVAQQRHGEAVQVR